MVVFLGNENPGRLSWRGWDGSCFRNEAIKPLRFRRQRVGYLSAFLCSMRRVPAAPFRENQSSYRAAHRDLLSGISAPTIVNWTPWS